MTNPMNYHYDKVTSEFVSSSPARPSPKEPSVYLKPAYTTQTPPPNAEALKASVFSNGAWVQVADHRGETWWNEGAAVTIEGLGDPLLEGLFADTPPTAGDKELVEWENGGWVKTPDHRGEVWWSAYKVPVEITELGDPLAIGLLAAEPPPSLAVAKAEKLEALEEKRWYAETGGIIIGGVPIATDRATCAILTAAQIRATADPKYVVSNWKVSTGVFTDLNAGTILAIASAVEAHVQASFTQEAQLSSKIFATTTLEGLSAIDINTGW